MNDTRVSPPVVNLLVIRSSDMQRAVEFYQAIGLRFALHRHGTGPEHYASEESGFVFEIYPRKDTKNDTSRTRIGFRVENVDAIVNVLRNLQTTIVTEPADTECGRRAVVKDFDGHSVELITPKDRDKD